MECSPDRLEQQIQRGVHVAEAHREVPGPDHLRADVGSASACESRTMSWWSVRRRAGHVVHDTARPGSAAQFVGDEVFGLADEVDGEAADPLALFAELPGGQRGHAEESRPPESRVQRGTSATSWRRTMSSSSSRTWRRTCPGRRCAAGSPAASRRAARTPARSTVTTVPGSTSRMPSHTACPGVLTKRTAHAVRRA